MSCFFLYYFDRNLFKQQSTAQGFDRVQLKESQASERVRLIFQRVREVYEMQSPLLTNEHHNYFYEALCNMNLKLATPIVAEVKNLHEKAAKNSSDLVDRESRGISFFLSSLF